MGRYYIIIKWGRIVSYLSFSAPELMIKELKELGYQVQVNCS